MTASTRQQPTATLIVMIREDGWSGEARMMTAGAISGSSVSDYDGWPTAQIAQALIATQKDENIRPKDSSTIIIAQIFL